jgi:hypothetical protein
MAWCYVKHRDNYVAFGLVDTVQKSLFKSQERNKINLTQYVCEPCAVVTLELVTVQ